MQYKGGDELSSTVLAHFSKNASYSENYHDKYYYTELVRQRVAARRQHESERPQLGGDRDPDEGGADGRRPGSGQEGAQRSGARSSGSGCRWYLITGSELSASDGRTAPYGEQQRHLDRPESGSGRPDPGGRANRADRSGNRDRPSRIAMADSKEQRQQQPQPQQEQPILATESSWEPIERSSAVGHCSESVTSEDSVFSEEDYGAMTDSPDSGRSASRWRAPLDGGGGCSGGSTDEADSSFSSPGGSTSTLEADGKEDGGGLAEDSVKDVSRPKLGDNDHDDEDGNGQGGRLALGVGPSGRRSGSPPASADHRPPNIKLILGQPLVDIDDESPSPSPPPPSPPGPGDAPQTDSADSDGGRQPLDSTSTTPAPTLAMMRKSESNSFYEDREFDFLKAEPVRRSTSLKTYKTPPGTPHRKKAVRFADALGLDLESVRHILNLEEPPEVPKSAIRHLELGLQDENRTDGVRYLSALFGQPCADPDFRRRVQDSRVALENCVVDDRELTISGTVRVANIAYEKLVVVRYTTNSWLSSEDVVASYVQNSNDGPTDRFSFTIPVPACFAVGQRLEFAIMYSAGGATYWDNNYGANYVVECYARAMPLSESDNTWMHFL